MPSLPFDEYFSRNGVHHCTMACRAVHLQCVYIEVHDAQLAGVSRCYTIKPVVQQIEMCLHRTMNANLRQSLEHRCGAIDEK